MKLKKIINLFGGPGVGKSTIASGLFYKMKTLGYSVEFVPEYAKELVYEDRMNVLLNDQLYIFAKQHRKIYRLINNVEYIITDSPLYLSLSYSKQMENIFNLELFSNFVYDVIKKYPNFNIFLNRNNKIKYDENGRYQDMENAKKIDNIIYKGLNETEDFIEITVDDKTISKILKLIKE